MTALGDVAAAVPHIEVIGRHHATDDVWLLTGPDALEIFANHPRLHLRVVKRHRHIGSTGKFPTLFWIRRQNFARVYDLQGNKLSRFFTRYSRSRERIGTQPLDAYTHAPNTPWTRTTHENVSERLNDTLGNGHG